LTWNSGERDLQLERTDGGATRDNFALHAQYLNPQLTKVVTTLGFDRLYEHGEGCYLYDDEDHRYLDMLSGFGCSQGRSHPAIKDALRQALDADLPGMVQMDCALLPGLLAEQLITRSPKQIERLFFCNSGAEAVEASIKFARASTGRRRILYHSHAYHGLTMGALAVNGSADFREGFGPLLADTTRSLRRPRGADSRAQARRRRGLHVEPIQGRVSTN